MLGSYSIVSLPCLVLQLDYSALSSCHELHILNINCFFFLVVEGPIYVLLCLGRLAWNKTTSKALVTASNVTFASFQGLTCLMQISTRTEDFIIDTLKLRIIIGPYLTEHFKDPTKRKVFFDYQIMSVFMHVNILLILFPFFLGKIDNARGRS
jgi:hypothetical protein